MKQVYAPANIAEAHMLVHMLGENSILAHILGEALQGGVGELPAGGLLQIMVAEEDHAAARRLIEAWEKTDTPAPTPKPALPFVAGLIVFVLGLLGGWALHVAAVNNAIPIDTSESRVDQNGDGVDDLTYFYRIGAPYAYKAEIDRNFDGGIDLIDHYDAAGIATRRESDDDFDGFTESRMRLRTGNPVSTEVDTNRNGVADIKYFFTDGVMRREEFHDNRTGRLARVNFYANLRLERAEIDLDRDGFLETIRGFDEFGEITSTETRTPPAAQ